MSYPRHSDPPPPYNSTHRLDAQTPLIAQRERWRKNAVLRLLYMYLSVIFLLLFLAQNLGLVRCPLNDVPAAEKAKLRLQWQRETAKWVEGRKEHAAEVRIWEQERSEHVAEQTTWMQERSQHAAEQRTWEQERVAWRVEREKEEQHRLEVVRRSQGVYWTEPRPERCRSYGTRIYSANLKNIPADLDWLEVCEEMPPVMIHGRNVSKPAKCDRNGKAVVGTWYIDFDEPICKPYWNDFTDLGCNLGNTGFRRFGARLDGISKGADRNLMCSTTAATIHGTHFDQPTTCEDRGSWGEVGLWDVPSPSCG